MQASGNAEQARPHKGALNDRVYDYIVSQIIVGAFTLNARLPTEMQLAERLSVSRPVVRQALRRLKDDGLVVSRQGAGTFVVRRPAHQVFSFAAVGSVADIQKCFAFRIALESEAAAIAAVEHDRESLDRLARALEDLERSLKSGTGGIDEDIAFHQTIAAASDNRFFLSTMTAIASQIRVGIGLNRSLTLEQPKSRRLAVQEEHSAIYDAIAARNADGARRLMHRHLENARLRIFEGGEY
ncbi:MAG: FadR family transcriptional regulator [Kiloniellales bacterium]|nr:FadR family transcriptional regulator [Kiloniellales bacterium]